MKDSWGRFFRRLVAAGVVSGSTAWWSALCYAQVASDNASDPVYLDGWQAGDNGGFGFTPWNFDSIQPNGTSYTSTDFHAIDDGLKNGTHYSNPFNDIGRSWTIGEVPATGSGPPRAGRGFAPLQVGQTIRMIIDNPTDYQHFRGYIIRFTSGGANICYGKSSCTPGKLPRERLGVYEFGYFHNNPSYTGYYWLVSDATNDAQVATLTDTETAAAGMQIDVKLTSPTTYQLTMDPLPAGPGGAGATFTQSGNLARVDFGDYNADGTVNAADYTVWRDHFVATQATDYPLPNEEPTTTPGKVTIQDYNVWKSYFGHSNSDPIDWIDFTFFNTPTDTGAPPTFATDLYIRSIQILNTPGSGRSVSAPGGGTTVPEPSTTVYLIVGALGTFVLCRTRPGRVTSARKMDGCSEGNCFDLQAI